MRVRSAGSAVRDATRVAGDKIARDLQEVGRVADSAVTSAKNIVPTRNVVAAGDVGRVHMPAENTHFFENKVSQMFSRADGVGGGGKPFVSSGQQFTMVGEIG
jgi:predicted urease superfamily metal-dependent hydrolase